MTTTAVNSATASQKGKKLGTLTGLGAGSAYLIKNRKDIFEKGVQEGIKQAHLVGKVVSKNKATAIAGGAAAIVIAAATAAGALIGKGIGTLVDKHNKKKQEYEFLKDKPAIVEGIMGKPTKVTMRNINKINKKIDEMYKKTFSE